MNIYFLSGLFQKMQVLYRIIITAAKIISQDKKAWCHWNLYSNFPKLFVIVCLVCSSLKIKRNTLELVLTEFSQLIWLVLIYG